MFHLVGRFLRSNRTEWKMLPDPEQSYSEQPPDAEPEPQEADTEKWRLRGAVAARLSKMASEISSETLEIGNESVLLLVNGSECCSNYMRCFRKCRT